MRVVTWLHAPVVMSLRSPPLVESWMTSWNTIWAALRSIYALQGRIDVAQDHGTEDELMELVNARDEEFRWLLELMDKAVSHGPPLQGVRPASRGSEVLNPWEEVVDTISSLETLQSNLDRTTDAEATLTTRRAELVLLLHQDLRRAMEEGLL